MNADTADRIVKLRELIAYHRARYHEADAPEISDQAYDSLVEELKRLEGVTDEDVSETTVVGGSVSEAFAKVTHEVRQWSLSNVFTESELIAWEERLMRHLQEVGIQHEPTYVVGPKLDGLKVVLTYRAGTLIRGATRGNGVVGEDVTHTVATISNIPHTLPKAIDVVCVGEVLLTYKEFERINSERSKNGEPLFANPRNAAAGSLRQLDPAIAAARKLEYHVYDLDAISVHETAVMEPTTQWDELQLLKSFGFTINQHSVQCTGIKQVQRYYESWIKKHGSLAYGVDGVVATVNELELQRQLGYTAKSPRFAVAYKFPAEQATTVVEAIHLQVGRTGVITPVAHLQPVSIDGSTVSRATLHNEDQIKRLDVRVGDTVILQKAGDIIPEIVSVVSELRPEGTRPYRFPTKVDGCGGDGSIERVPGEAAYRCVQLDSKELHRQRLYYFVSKQALNVDGVGPRIIDLLLDEGLIEHHYDLFTLELGDVVELPGFKEKAAQNVLNAIAAARTVPLHRLLIGLSIEHVGEETARLIASYFPSIAAIREVTQPELAAIHGVGDVVATSVVEWFADPQHEAQLNALLPHLTVTSPNVAPTNTKLAGKTVVFTGSLPTVTRDEAKELARRAGAQVSSSVSKKTDFVVAGDEAGSKLDTATSLGVQILTEAEFLKMAS